ncbi:MAG: hypothetical protein ACI837_000817 [Crocinitomicaceae bacterium]|jgi:hypothetical protein
MRIIGCITLLMTFSGVAQESSISMEMPEMQILYNGYANVVEFKNAGDETYFVRCTGCDTIYRTSLPNKYAIKAKRSLAREVVLTLYRDAGTKVVLKSFRLRVINLPDPELFFGATKSGSKIAINASRLFAKYPPEIPLRASFVITKWTLSARGEKFTGAGSKLSEEAMAFLKMLSSDEIVSLITQVRGPDGITRSLGGAYTL